jgi:hypothetical protein
MPQASFERLGWRQVLTLDPALRDRSFLDGIDRLARLAIEAEDVPGLGTLQDGRYDLAVALKFDERRLRCEVVVPDIVVNELPVPSDLAGCGAQSNERIRVKIVALAFAAIEIRTGRTRRHVDETEFGIRGERCPGVRRAVAGSFLAVPCRVGGVARVPGDRVPAPAFSAAARIDAAHDPEFRLDGTIVPDSGTDNDGIAHDDRWRGHGVNHPLAFRLGADIQVEPHLSLFAEVIARPPSRPIERDQAGIQRSDKKPVAAGISRVGLRVQPRGNAAVCNLCVRLAAIDLGVVAPDLLARRRVEREDDGTAGRQVKPSLDQYRVRLEGERLPVSLTQFPGPEPPCFLEPGDIARVQLRQTRVLHSVLAATVMNPVRMRIHFTCCQLGER